MFSVSLGATGNVRVARRWQSHGCVIVLQTAASSRWSETRTAPSDGMSVLHWSNTTEETLHCSSCRNCKLYRSLPFIPVTAWPTTCSFTSDLLCGPFRDLGLNKTDGVFSWIKLISETILCICHLWISYVKWPMCIV